MSRCTDKRIGDMLHAYELRQLSEEASERFELHLLSCAHCFQEASSFDGVASLLRSDPDVQQAVAAARETEVAGAGESVWARIRDYVWPQKPFFLRPAVAYFIIVLLAYPAYRGLVGGGQEVAGVQSLILTGGRSTPGQPAAVGQPLVIMFHVDGATSGSEFRVVVRSQSGEVIYSNDRFSDFNEREMATILLAPSALTPGQYHIDVYDPDSDSPLHQYTFLAQ